MVKFINYLFIVHDDIPWKLRNITFLKIIIVIIIIIIIIIIINTVNKQWIFVRAKLFV